MQSHAALHFMVPRFDRVAESNLIGYTQIIAVVSVTRGIDEINRFPSMYICASACVYCSGASGIWHTLNCIDTVVITTG